jgi:hypothetical protein
MSDFKRAAEALSDAREIVVCWRRLKTDPMGQFSVSGNRLGWILLSWTRLLSSRGLDSGCYGGLLPPVKVCC